MPKDWDQYYADADNIDLTPDPLLVETVAALPPGDALDLACGAGRHALHLAELGWRVTAVDAAAAAIHGLNDRAKQYTIETHRADLEHGEFLIEPQSFDLICDFFYLLRELFPQIREGLRPGGIFLGAIHLEGTFSLPPGELKNEFPGWEILSYSEDAAARIAAKKP